MRPVCRLPPWSWISSTALIRFIWGIYRYLRWPDLEVILAGDPAVCRTCGYAAVSTAASTKAAPRRRRPKPTFTCCPADMLAYYGYPVEVLSIDGRTAEQVADAVVGLICDRMGTASPSD